VSERVPAEAFPPGEYLKDEIEERGWTQEELAAIIGRPPAVINQIISGKRGISPETAREIGAALGTSAMYWMNLEAAYRLWFAGPAPTRIARAARVRTHFPVREMIKRGWVKASENPDVVEQQVLKFFGIASVEETPRLAHAAKKTGYPDDISGVQRAWLFRVKQIAETMPARSYSERALRDALPILKALRPSVDELRRVPHILAECGVRFVIVEHMPASKIDGVCFWLDGRATGPVIGMSLRLDRIDNFWFVLRHEIEHVLNGDGREVAVIDRDTEPSDAVTAQDVSQDERLANAAAADFCVPQADMADFILRHKPLFSEDKVMNFARRMQLHPGLVVGQLQRKVGNYRLFRKHLVGVRDVVAPVSMTDGYGQVLPITL
jgi:HTH-type transcriptional regulator / antitoxin HigA